MFSSHIDLKKDCRKSVTQHLGHFLCYNWSVIVNPSDENGEHREFRFISECTENLSDTIKQKLEAEINIIVYDHVENQNILVGRGDHKGGRETVVRISDKSLFLDERFPVDISVTINVTKAMGILISLPDSSPIVKLNVGGTEFHTTEHRLDGRMKIYFQIEKLRHAQNMDPVFFDRDTKHFRLILNFLRDETVNLPDSDKEVEEILEEANFYWLTRLAEICTEHLSRKTTCNSAPVIDIVQLDIGGTVFKSTKSTLTRFDGMFKTMLDNQISEKKQGFESIFIDRSPKHFDLILNFMRDGDVELPDSNRELREVLKEAQYYLLGGLVGKCENYLDNIVVA